MPLSFAAPLILLGLLTLPAIWWLLRLTPPRPQTVRFPPTRLLLDIIKPDETPAHSPWWLTALRLAIAAAIILALAGPIWQASTSGSSISGNPLIIVDNSFAAADDWDARQRAMGDILDQAEAAEALVTVVPTIPLPQTARSGDAVLPDPISPTQARTLLQAITPQPLTVDRMQLVRRVGALLNNSTVIDSIVLVSDGLGGLTNTDGDNAFISMLNGSGLPLTLFEKTPDLVGLSAPENGVSTMTIRAVRTGSTTGSREETNRLVQAFDLQNRPIATANLTFDNGATTAEAELDLPTELRNVIARVTIEGEPHVAASHLLDDRWRRKVVGILSGEGAEAAQPLLSPAYYVRRALQPFADLRAEIGSNIATSVDAFLNEGVSVIIMTDVGTLLGDASARLQGFIEDGGLVVRFAGPRLASSEDDLVPVPLRSGGRVLGGSLSWETPQQLAGFDADSPFADLQLTDQIRAETTVRQQVLAEPGLAVADRSWAYLEDGTPLVTARQIGEGWLVLFHVTADANWSDLPLSGLFVDMLRATLPLARTNLASASPLATTSEAAQLAPFQSLTARGELAPPPAHVQTVPARGAITPATLTPPGFYGTPDRYRAINVVGDELRLAAFDSASLETVARNDFAPPNAVDLKPALFILALLLLLSDALAVLFMQGVFGRLRNQRRLAATTSVMALIIACLAFTVSVSPAFAQADSDLQRAIEDANTPRLAYVITGNGEIDDLSRQGLSGLTQFMASRSSLEAGYPRGLNIETDELSFYPLIYWPIDPASETPSDATMARIDAFMKQGGSILFDTRDQLSGGGEIGFGASPATQKLREILTSLDVPPLEPVPVNHVLTKSFFLLQDFPGRFEGSPLWVQARSDGSESVSQVDTNTADGVSPILITANDFAGAWALTVDGRPLLPVVPGSPRQREMAFRSGLNIAMYALTGNYKADQVHLPDLLERLGQ